MLFFHDLRHSFAVTSLQAGDDIKTVQANLGHATAAFTLDVYGHVSEKMRRDSATRMQKFYESKILPKIILYKANFRTKFHLNTEICKEVRVIENILWQILFKNPNT